MLSSFKKDFTRPRTAAAFTGYVNKAGAPSPAGVVLHVMSNSRFACTQSAYEQEKGPMILTVVGIKHLGYVYAPWKRPAKNAKKAAQSVPTQKLLEEVDKQRLDAESVITAVKLYSFERQGQADKGNRNDAVNFVLRIGDTLRFLNNQYMFDKAGLFPDDMDFVDPFKLMEVVVEPAAETQCAEGWGIKLRSMRMLPYSMYSYLTPLNKQLLASSTLDSLIDSTVARVTDDSKECYYMRQMLEQRNHGFLTKVDSGAVLVTASDDVPSGFFRICSKSGNVAPGIPAVDIGQQDLMHYLNAGTMGAEAMDYVKIITQMAVQSGALYLWVFHNEYFTRASGTPGFVAFRGVPLIDTEALLEFIHSDDIDEEDAKEGFVLIDLPCEIPKMTDPTMKLAVAPVLSKGSMDVAPVCVDFPLSSIDFLVEHAYLCGIGPAEMPDLVQFIFRRDTASGDKRAAEETDWDALAKIRRFKS